MGGIESLAKVFIKIPIDTKEERVDIVYPICESMYYKKPDKQEVKNKRGFLGFEAWRDKGRNDPSKKYASIGPYALRNIALCAWTESKKRLPEQLKNALPHK